MLDETNILQNGVSLMERLVGLPLRWLGCVGLILTSAVSFADDGKFDPASIEFFERNVRPILVERCYECHSTGDKEPKGGLRLDSRQATLMGGDTGPAVNLDKPAASLLISAVNYGDLYQMPPKSKLPASEIATLTKWVEMGLPWPAESSADKGHTAKFDLAERAAKHWCWQPLTSPTSPTVTNSDWPMNEIDRFILSRLESQGLTPAAAADRATLLRRAYFDLIGLPPSPGEVEAFIADDSPKAFESVVDRLLNSVHFGERWGRHWLDLVRYAETRGHEFEPIIPNAWQYRDYVIRALNLDVPYNRFLMEQIAGDLIEPRWRATSSDASPTNTAINESILGTGFWFLGEEVHSPVDIRRDETDRMDNRLDVLSKTFLGLTVSCARCHDHKFDAISQHDYYALAGFAISSGYRQIRVDTDAQHQEVARRLDALRRQSKKSLVTTILRSTEPTLTRTPEYLSSAARLIADGVTILPTGEAGNTPNQDSLAAIERTAKANSLDAVLLGRWCVELQSAGKDGSHQLHRVIHSPSEPETAERTSSATKQPEAPNLVVDFDDARNHPPLQDGVSFGLSPIRRGQLVFDGSPDAPSLSIATTGGWQRDLFWKNIRLAPQTEVDNGVLGNWQRSGRTVRTPEFTLTESKLWYRVRGSIRAYAAVNSHLIIVGPLHNSLLREYKQSDNQWRWVSQDMDAYRGHRMHVEFSPADDDLCSIAMVVQSADEPKSSDRISFQQSNVAKHDSFNDRLAAWHKSLTNAVNSVERSLEQPSVERDLDVSLANWFFKNLRLFTTDPVHEVLASADRNLKQSEEKLASSVTWESSLAPAMLDGNGVDEYLLVRGNSNTPKDLVPRRFLEAFEGSKQTNSTMDGSGRRQLAIELLKTPLASRVAVNRIWHHLFGRGIVPSVDNFGVLGQPPSHPELLDYLANEFVRTGWSTKAMIRTLVLSQTYRMSSRLSENESLDPDNRLWHRMPIKRLEGEAIRDSLLAVSGRLDRTPFGRSVPIHLTEFMQGRGRPKDSGPLDGNGRRSIYISVRRNFLSPMMLAFDTPNPFSTVGRRTVSNVPAQALILLNDPFVIEQASHWADRILAEPDKTTSQKIDQMYMTAFGRHPTNVEITEAVSFLQSNGNEQKETSREAWSNLCHVMFNLKEFIFVE